MAEIVKTAWIGDRDLLRLMTGDVEALTHKQWQELVMRCVAVKAQVVSEDEREAGARAALNLGHTLGHALEAATDYRYFLHGEAVAWGLLAAAKLGRRRGQLSQQGESALCQAVADLGPLPSLADIDPEAVSSHIGRDKKKDAEGIGWVLPTDTGVILDQKVATDEALEVFRGLKNTSFQRD
jgi:3-dehydroquinate synthase